MTQKHLVEFVAMTQTSKSCNIYIKNTAGYAHAGYFNT